MGESRPLLITIACCTSGMWPSESLLFKGKKKTLHVLKDGFLKVVGMSCSFWKHHRDGFRWQRQTSGCQSRLGVSKHLGYQQTSTEKGSKTK